MSEPSQAPTPDGELILSLRGICKNFGAVSALTDIDLDVHAGEVVALVGDNGAGKSTLVKVLAGVHQPTSGTIHFHGQPVTMAGPSDALEARHRHRLPGPRALREPRRRRQPLPRPRAQPAGSSTRWRWRCAPGRCSASSPRASRACASRSPRSRAASARPSPSPARCCSTRKIIMLDEPTAALGVAQTAEVLNLIERLRDRGHGVIMISHNMEDVRAVADRIVVLRLGRNNGIFTPDVLERRAGRRHHRRHRQRRLAPRRPPRDRDRRGGPAMTRHRPEGAARPQRQPRRPCRRAVAARSAASSTGCGRATSARCRSSSGS